MVIEKIKESISETWDNMSQSIILNTKSYSSEKSLVFNFAWNYYRCNLKTIEAVDFECSLFDGYSNGTFLDLLIIQEIGNSKVKIGIEFKFMNRKSNNTGQTQVRTKIINDLKKLSWLVNKKRIDIGCFLCLTNEHEYINVGRKTVLSEFATHHNKFYKQGTFFPTDIKLNENVKVTNDINFKWQNIQMTKQDRYVIDNYKYAVLEPIFIFNYL